MEVELQQTAEALGEVWQVDPTKRSALLCKLIAIHSVGALFIAFKAL